MDYEEKYRKYKLKYIKLREEIRQRGRGQGQSFVPTARITRSPPRTPPLTPPDVLTESDIELERVPDFDTAPASSASASAAASASEYTSVMYEEPTIKKLHMVPISPDVHGRRRRGRERGRTEIRRERTMEEIDKRRRRIRRNIERICVDMPEKIRVMILNKMLTRNRDSKRYVFDRFTIANDVSRFVSRAYGRNSDLVGTFRECLDNYSRYNTISDELLLRILSIIYNNLYSQNMTPESLNSGIYSQITELYKQEILKEIYLILSENDFSNISNIELLEDELKHKIKLLGENKEFSDIIITQLRDHYSEGLETIMSNIRSAIHRHSDVVGE
jgi:hypothetical protein